MFEGRAVAFITKSARPNALLPPQAKNGVPLVFVVLAPNQYLYLVPGVNEGTIHLCTTFIWSNLGNQTLCINEVWPLEDVIRKSEIKIAVQINGKTKEIIEVDEKFSKEKVLETVKLNNKIKKNLLGKNIVREIYVPGKIVNLVIK